MSWALAIYPELVRVAAASLVLLTLASLAVLLSTQPARKARSIELTLVALLMLPWLALIPGYPRWSVLPALSHLESAATDIADDARKELQSQEDPQAMELPEEPVALAEAPTTSYILPAGDDLKASYTLPLD